MLGLCFWLIKLTLLFTFYQDWRYRAIHWFIIPVLSLLFLTQRYLVVGWELKDFGVQLLVNFGFLAVQFAFVWLYFLMVKKESQIVDKWIGKGDLYFLVACCFAFPLDQFIIYYISGLVFSLLVYMGLVRWTENKSIPLAGLLAIWMMVFPFVYTYLEFYLPSIQISEP